MEQQTKHIIYGSMYLTCIFWQNMIISNIYRNYDGFIYQVEAVHINNAHILVFSNSLN